MIIGGGLAAALGAALAWAGLDTLRKVLAAEMGPIPLTAVLVLGQLVLFVVWALLSGAEAPQPGYWPPALLAMVVNLAAAVLFTAALRASPLSLTVPMLSLTPVFAVVTAGLLLGEYPTGRQGLGIVFVLAGAALLQGGQSLRKAAGEPGVPMMVGVAALWSLTLVLDKWVLQDASVPTHGAVLSLGIAVGLLVLMVMRGELGELRMVARRPGLYAVSALTLAVATALQLLAIQLVLVSVVEGLKRATGLAAAVVNGRLVFGEAITLRKVAAIAVMGLGAALLL